jgi:hypothetical protein
MEAGESGVSGRNVVRPVDKERRPENENVTIQNLNTEETIAGNTVEILDHVK